MRNLRLTAFSVLSIAFFAIMLTACGGMKSTNANTSSANTTNKALVPVAANANQAPTTNAAPASNTSAPVALSDAEDIEGELQVGKTESVILYVGMESGDYAAYCFANDSEPGKAILTGCKDRDQCRVTGIVDYEASCTVPGLEADLSSKGRITKVATVKSLGPRKK